MKNKTLEVLIGALDEFISDNQISESSAVGAAIHAAYADACAELELSQAPITIDALKATGWRQSDDANTTFYCPTTDGLDFEVIVYLEEAGWPIVSIFINGEYVTTRGVKSIADLTDLCRLLTGKDPVFSNREQPNT